MLQKIANPPLPVVWESGRLSKTFGQPEMKRCATSDFPEDHCTVRTHAVREGSNAHVAIYFKRADQNRMVAYMYGEQGDRKVGFNSGGCSVLDLPHILKIINDIEGMLASLKS
jgi:hypothetical protein